MREFSEYPISYKVTITSIPDNIADKFSTTEIYLDEPYEKVADFVSILIKNRIRFELTYEDNELVDKINEVMGDA